MMLASKNAILAIVLFLAIVGGLTWYMQYMPGRGVVQDVPKGPAPVAVREVLRFVRTAEQVGPLHAVFEVNEEGKDAEYVLESEKGEKGEYSFLFHNVLDRPAEMEMDRADCDCTHADIGIVPYEQWTKIDAVLAKTPYAKPSFETEPEWYVCQKNQHNGIKIPAGAYGVLRVRWDGRKEPGGMLKLHLLFWCQPEGEQLNRQTVELWVPVKVVQPLQFEPGKYPLGLLGPGDHQTAEFHVWSSTRDKPDVIFGPRDEKEKDPLFKIDAKPLTPEQCKKLQHDLRTREKPLLQIYTRVKAGYLVKVTVYEQADGHQMDQGPFIRPVPIILDEAPVTWTTPQVGGHIRGPLEVGGEADQAKVQLRLFSAAETKTAIVPIYGDPAFSLQIDHKYPPFLQVDLQRKTKESTAQRARWDLKVTIPAKAWTGALPDDSRVVLRIGGNPPRLVRIPVVGTATQWDMVLRADRRKPPAYAGRLAGWRASWIDKTSEKGDEWAFPAAADARRGSSPARQAHDAERAARHGRGLSKRRCAGATLADGRRGDAAPRCRSRRRLLPAARFAQRLQRPRTIRRKPAAER
jgi:hypothetical protein